jgi:hypothetical protein
MQVPHGSIRLLSDVHGNDHVFHAVTSDIKCPRRFGSKLVVIALAHVAQIEIVVITGSEKPVYGRRIVIVLDNDLIAHFDIELHM